MMTNKRERCERRIREIRVERNRREYDRRTASYRATLDESVFNFQAAMAGLFMSLTLLAVAIYFHI